MTTKISALVSTYNSEQFIRGRIEDLLQQSVYTQGRLEIIVINAGSKQSERYILRQYFGCITYLESLRESIYQSWNRGIAISTGEYLINANADDRFHPNALERMANALDMAPDIGLVYADAIVTSTANATWHGNYEISEKPPYMGRITWPDYDPRLLQIQYFGGPNPMWRKSLHEQYGLFDPSYQLAGDYEWMLRLSANAVQCKRLSEPLTLFYDDGANINNGEYAGMESRRASLRWRR